MTDPETQAASQREKMAAARLSLLSNSLLTACKLTIGVLTNSVGVLSDGAHSASDVIASGLALYTVREAGRPPDEDHPYGHGKMESVSAFLQAQLLFGAGSYVVYEAVQHLIHREGPHRVDWGMGVMAASALINAFIVRVVSRAAERTRSPSLHAAAQDHRADIVTATGVLIGLILVRVTGKSFFDPMLALAVAVVIFHGAWEVVRDALRNLVDRRLPDEDRKVVTGVFEKDPAVLGFHKLRTRMAGSLRHVDAHVLMDDSLSLLEAHNRTEALEAKIRAALPDSVVTLHTEPFDAERKHQADAHGAPVPDETIKGKSDSEDARLT